MSLYDRLAAAPDGARALAKARLRVAVTEALWEAVQACGGEDEFCRRAGIRRRTLRRVSRERRDLRITTLADWLHAAGFEVEVRLVPAGQPRQEVLDRRAPYAQLKQERDDALDRIDYVRHEIEGWNSRDHHLWRAVREALGDPTWTGDPRPMPKGKPRPKELGQKSPEGVVRPPLVTVQQETPPPPSAPQGGCQ